MQADYEALVTAMNQQIAQAPTQAEKDAIRKHFERNVFPLLYAQVQAIGASGALDPERQCEYGPVKTAAFTRKFNNYAGEIKRSPRIIYIMLPVNRGN